MVTPKVSGAGDSGVAHQSAAANSTGLRIALARRGIHLSVHDEGCGSGVSASGVLSAVTMGCLCVGRVRDGEALLGRRIRGSVQWMGTAGRGAGIGRLGRVGVLGVVLWFEWSPSLAGGGSDDILEAVQPLLTDDVHGASCRARVDAVVACGVEGEA